MEIGEGGGRGDGEASDLLLPIKLEWIRQTSVPKVEETAESGPHLAVTMEPSFERLGGPGPIAVGFYYVSSYGPKPGNGIFSFFSELGQRLISWVLGLTFTSAPG